MNQIDELTEAVDEEMAALGDTLDELEEALDAVDSTLSGNKLDKTESTKRVTVDDSRSGVQPAGAD